MSTAPVDVLLLPCRKATLSCTQSTTAWTRCHPGSTPPNSFQAVLPSRSDSQYRLARVKCSVEFRQIRHRGLRRRLVGLIDTGVHHHLGLVADANAPRTEHEPLARVPVDVRVPVQLHRRPRFHAGTRQRPHGIRAGLHLQDEGDRPFEVVEKFTAHAKQPIARGGVDHVPHCTAELQRVNRSGCTSAGARPCAP